LKKLDLRVREDTCSGIVCNGCCMYLSEDDYAGPGWKTVSRGDELFKCPPVAVFESRVKARKEAIEEETRSRNSLFAYTAVGVLLFLVGVVGLVASIAQLVKVHRKAKAGAAAG